MPSGAGGKVDFPLLYENSDPLAAGRSTVTTMNALEWVPLTAIASVRAASDGVVHICGACFPCDQLGRFHACRILKCSLRRPPGAGGCQPEWNWPAGSILASSSAVALECSFDMAEPIFTSLADYGWGIDLCFAGSLIPSQQPRARRPRPRRVRRLNLKPRLRSPPDSEWAGRPGRPAVSASRAMGSLGL